MTMDLCNLAMLSSCAVFATFQITNHLAGFCYYTSSVSESKGLKNGTRQIRKKQHHERLILVLVLNKDYFIIKRMLATWNPYTRASFLCQCLQVDTGKCMLSSPPASPLPKYGRNRIRAGRRTKTQPKRVIRANVCLVRHPCHNR